MKMGHLFAGERDKPDRSLRLPRPHQPGDFQQHGDRRGVVVGSGAGRHCVVVGTDNDNFVRSARSRQLGDQIANLLPAGQIRLSLDCISRGYECSLRHRGGGGERVGQSDVTRSNDSGQLVDMPA